MREDKVYSATIGGREFTIATGKLAEQASGACTVRYGDTIVLAAVVAAKEAMEGRDFLPLTVDYEERMYAAGKIPGGFIKREGRPTETATLTARLTDRPIRPLLPKLWRSEIQVTITTLSSDQENEPAILSIIGASAAMLLSEVPFNGPVGAAKVGYINGEYILNPTAQQLQTSDLELTIAGTADAVSMVEAWANELPEAVMLEAVRFGWEEGIKPVIELQRQMAEDAQPTKRDWTAPVPDTSLQDRMTEWLGNRLGTETMSSNKVSREAATDALRQEAVNHFVGEVAIDEINTVELAAGKAWDAILKENVRTAILERGERPDGRGPRDIREITAEVGVLPRTHGSGLFTRGQTQVLSIATLGTGADEQMLDGLGIEDKKRYIHHYNFPSFSTGEARRGRGPSRRDIGHGALAERSLIPVLPKEEDFPYVIRVVSETLSSNGSSSMASVCGSTLSLLDAGVPLKAPVAGIAMGLVESKDGTQHKVLTDIQGIEDALGDMDFKVAGTREGVTGLQLDLKTSGLAFAIMEEAFEQAREARLFILDKMAEVISEPRAELSLYAPRILRIKINPEKIGALIGPGGKNIRGITEQTGTKIDVEDDGTVLVASTDGESAKKAIRMIEGLTKEAEVGEIYLGKVVRILPYGAFVEVLPGKDGLVHISELADYRVERVEDVVNIGDEINVMVIDVDRQGKISLSRKAVLTGEMPPPRDRDRDRGDRPGFGDRDRGPRPGGGGGGYGDRDRGPRPGGGGGGYGDRDRGPRPGGGGYGDRDRGPRPGSGPGGPGAGPSGGPGPAPAPGGERGGGDRDNGGGGGRW
ncbi:MAG TPA: polyribonucleotide nucleotidyltransferase [Chloroflexia bacterium]|nr:polyribonucleotide nucleotidyltransferase [Chloroflexia bacterium]